jgi:hypothetical protein
VVDKPPLTKALSISTDLLPIEHIILFFKTQLVGKKGGTKKIKTPFHDIMRSWGTKKIRAVEDQGEKDRLLINYNGSATTESSDDWKGTARRHLIDRTRDTHHNSRARSLIEQTPVSAARSKKSLFELKLLDNRHAMEPHKREPLHYSLFKATIRTDMSAGAMPGIRDACPRLSGRVLVRRNLASVRSPVTAW